MTHDVMLGDLEDFIRSVSDAAGEEPPKFRRSDLAEHLTAFLDQVEDGDAEFAFGLPTPYEEHKHPRGYHGRWTNAVHAALNEDTHRSVKELAKDTGLDENAVSTALAHLYGQGHVESQTNRGKVGYKRKAGAPIPERPPEGPAEVSHLLGQGKLLTRKQLAQATQLGLHEVDRILSDLAREGRLDSGNVRGQSGYRLAPAAGQSVATSPVPAQRKPPAQEETVSGSGLPPLGPPETADEPPRQQLRSGVRDYAPYQAPRASDKRLEEVGQHLDAAVRQLAAHAGGEQVRIHALRARFPQVPRREFDDALIRLSKQHRVRLVSIGDYRDFTEAQLAESIPGANEVLGYVKPLHAEFAFGQEAYLSPGGQSLFVPGPSGTATFDEVSLDSDEALPWLEHYHCRGQHPPAWPATLPLPEEPIDLEALAQEVRLGQAAERVEQALEAQRVAPDELSSWTQEDLDAARVALQEARQEASLADVSLEEEADQDEPGLSADTQAWFEAVEDGRVSLGDATFAFGLPHPYEEHKHPRGYGGKWIDKPGAAAAAAAHQAAEKNLRKHEANLGKLAAKVEKLHQSHAAAKAAHAEAKKKAKGKAHSRAALEAHQAELVAIRAKGKLDAAKVAHSEAKKEHAQAKKEHGQTAKTLEKATKEKPAAQKKEPKPKKAVAKAKQLQVPDVPGFRPGEVKVDQAAYIPDDKPIQERIKDYTRGDQLIQALAHIERVRDWASQRSLAAARELDWDTYRQAVNIQDQYTGIGGRDAAHQILAEHIENKVDWRTDVKGDLDPAVRLAHDQGMEFLRNTMGKGHSALSFQTTAPVQQVPKDVEQRAYHSTSLGIHLSEKSNAGTMVHEFGHWFDDHLPGVLEATQAFLKYRVGNESAESMADVSRRVYGYSSGYGADEMGRMDHFNRAFPVVEAYYTGKDYGSRATEVLSMGLEKLYNDPIHFAQKDPEFFKFILGVCDGSLRDHDRDRGLDLGDLGGF